MHGLAVVIRGWRLSPITFEDPAKQGFQVTVYHRNSLINFSVCLAKTNCLLGRPRGCPHLHGIPRVSWYRNQGRNQIQRPKELSVDPSSHLPEDQYDKEVISDRRVSCAPKLANPQLSSLLLHSPAQLAVNTYNDQETRLQRKGLQGSLMLQHPPEYAC